MVARLVDVLAQLGRLDDALIIVHADHGDVEFLASPESALGPDAAFALDPAARHYQQPDQTYQDDAMLDRLYHADSATWRSIAVEVLSSALLLVKFPDVTTYSEDTRPVQLLDIAPTILEHAGASIAPYDGIPMSRVPSTRISMRAAVVCCFRSCLGALRQSASSRNSIGTVSHLAFAGQNRTISTNSVAVDPRRS